MSRILKKRMEYVFSESKCRSEIFCGCTICHLTKISQIEISKGCCYSIRYSKICAQYLTPAQNCVKIQIPTSIFNGILDIGKATVLVDFGS